MRRGSDTDGGVGKDIAGFAVREISQLGLKWDSSQLLKGSVHENHYCIFGYLVVVVGMCTSAVSSSCHPTPSLSYVGDTIVTSPSNHTLLAL